MLLHACVNIAWEGGAVTKQRSYLGESPEDRVARRRAQMIDAGLEVFGSVGYRRSRVSDVCDVAGLSKRYFYESFADRAALLLAVYQHVDEAQREVVMDALGAVDPDEKDLMVLVRTSIRAQLDFLAEDPRRGKILYVEMYQATDPVTEAYRESLGSWTGVVAEILGERASQNGLSPEVLAEVYVSAVLGIVLRWVMEDQRQAPQAVVQAIELLFSGAALSAAADEG
ncbi:MAG: TetR/AcrR family transcriptional regulator [Actinomycetales bacterium]|nr:MAG: TetR/AcrR family transcriptional regulator [Actinomycetales bacterium]